MGGKKKLFKVQAIFFFPHALVEHTNERRKQINILKTTHTELFVHFSMITTVKLKPNEGVRCSGSWDLNEKENRTFQGYTKK